MRNHLHLAAVHEIDPDQLQSASGLRATLDTSPLPRDSSRYDAWFIAGFHASHADLAIRALQGGAYAVVEKPLVTTREQLLALRGTLANVTDRRLFTCFHRRYSRLHEWARADLGLQPGERVDMHCIVYEIPLPSRHWYNWPNSGSRLISNGCHWLDYFLYVNDYSPVRDRYVRPTRGSDLVAAVGLENGAQLVLSLTDTGSERLGVRDLIDLRARNVTVRLTDSTYYDAESSTRTLRRARVNPMNAYARMYDTICRRIAAGRDGDAPESLRSTELMLDLEEDVAKSFR
jgi:predicted dehydrogenase